MRRALVMLPVLVPVAVAVALAGCATRAPEGRELWVPRGQAARPAAELDGAEVWVPADASRARTAHDDRATRDRSAQVDVSTAE